MESEGLDTRPVPVGAPIRGMTTATGRTGRELVYTRTFDAPRAQVFAAWTEQEQLARWWGPHSMTNSVCAVDLRPGGHYRIVMRAPDGIIYPLTGEYREVVEPERLVFTIDTAEHPTAWHAMLRSFRPAASSEVGLRAVVTLTFEARGERTKLTIVNEYESVETLEAVVKMGSNDGWAQSLERLESLLTKSAAQPSDREIGLTRLVRAPREVVFRAFTEPQHVVHWWGPFGYTNTIHYMAARPGGISRLTMHGPDGKDYPVEIRYREVVQPERLVYQHSSGAANDPEAFDEAITLASEGDGTRVTTRATFATAAQATEARGYGVELGNQLLARLDGYLGTMRECASAGVAEGVVPGTDEDDFVVNRVFEAPRDLVFRAMTEPAHLERWFGPPGTKIRVVSSDLKPGGQLRYAMPEGAKETFGRFVYREIAPPGRLAYVVSFADEKFAPTRHPLSKAWPLEVLAIETLGSFDGKTLFFSRTIPIYATQEERETFRAGHSSMVQGLKGALDQLDEYLKTLR